MLIVWVAFVLNLPDEKTSWHLVHDESLGIQVLSEGCWRAAAEAYEELFYSKKINAKFHENLNLNLIKSIGSVISVLYYASIKDNCIGLEGRFVQHYLSHYNYRFRSIPR